MSTPLATHCEACDYATLSALQTQATELATAERETALIQQNKDDIAVGTQTAIANFRPNLPQVAEARTPG